MSADDSIDLFGLFLALAEARLAEARASLEPSKEDHGPAGSIDAARLAASMVPLAVDAALLGAEGVSTLAVTIARVRREHAAEAASALGVLSEAIGQLGHGDSSGARADEAALLAAAKRLGHGEHTAAPVSEVVASSQTVDDTQWIPALPEELVSPFLDECHERIEGLSARLLKIEEEGVAAAGGEEVRALFRDLHTLKGSSGFAGLVRLNRLAHAAEDLVARMRDGIAPCDRPVIDVLLASIDRFRAIVERASARAPIDVEIDDVVARLRDPRSAPRPVVKPKETTAAPTPDPKTALPVGTLRVEFERVDQLQNYVNELVLARGRLTRATAVQIGLAREITRVRRHLGELGAVDPGSERAREITAIAEELGRTERVVDEGAFELESSLGTLGGALTQLRDRVMKLRMVPIARLFTKHQRTVRELGQQLGKKVRLELSGQDTELDKVLVEQLEDPLIHLVRNAIDHGLEKPEVRAQRGKAEAGVLSLRARHRGGSIVVEVADDGGGIDPKMMREKGVEKGLVTRAEADEMSDHDALDLVFRAGFSTAAEVTDVSGRGVGMDVVRESIARLKGTIEIRSEVGAGTTFELRLPLTLAVAHVLIARVGGEDVAIPIDAVSRTLAISARGDGVQSLVEDVGGRACLVEETSEGRTHVPIVDLAATLGLDARRDSSSTGEARAVGGSGDRGGHLVVIDAPLGDIDRVALECDALLGRHEVVVKPLGPLLARAPCVAGASLVGDRVVLLLDVAAVVRRGLDTEVAHPTRATEVRRKRGRILVAEDADVVREALRHALEGAGFEVVVARDGAEALEKAQAESFDLVSTDVMMPRLDGYGLTRGLRALPAYAKTPIVMVTSRDQRVDVLRGYDAGVDAYVTKPADVNALLRTVDELLARKA